MKVIELFKSLDIGKFVREYMDYEGLYSKIWCNEDISVEEKIKRVNYSFKEFEDIFSDLLKLRVSPQKSEFIVFSVPEEGTGMLNSFVVHRAEIKSYNGDTSQLPQRYGYEFSPIEEILNYEVSEVSRYIISDDIRLAASIFYEITFLGYLPEERELKIEKTNALLDEAMQDVKKGNIEKFHNLETVFSDIGYKDKRKDFEKEFENKKDNLESESFVKMSSLLFLQEKKYIGSGVSAEI